MSTVTSSGSAVLTLPTDTQILITREFDAPKHLVFKAWTTPELVKRWWHAKRGDAQIADIDLRPGGTWRWVMYLEDGTEVAFHGEYKEIVENERIVYTEVYEGVPEEMQGDGTLNTLTLEEVGGKTRATILTEAYTKDVRDMIIESGMEGGMQDALDLLEEVARSLA